MLGGPARPGPARGRGRSVSIAAPQHPRHPRHWRGEERSAAGLPRAPGAGWAPSLLPSSRRVPAPFRTVPILSSCCALLRLFLLYFILFFFPLPGSRQASPSMPIAHLLELWKGIEVEPMETEVSRGAAGTPTLPSEPHEHRAPPPLPARKPLWCPKPGGVRGASGQPRGAVMGTV